MHYPRTTTKPAAAEARPAGPAMPVRPSNHVLHEKGRCYYWNGVGVLSIKSFYGGRAFYNTGRGSYAVDDTSYLVLNHGQRYSIEIQSEQPVESFCLFFDDAFAKNIVHSLTGNTVDLMDDPSSSRAARFNFFERTYPHDDLVSPVLFGLKGNASKSKEEPNWFEEQLHVLLQRLLERHSNALHECERLQALKSGTREELYRRLHRARDFIHASFNQSITLSDMAEAACLSPNHFLRTFKELFRQTPHQYLTARRLDEAKRLIEATDLPVTEVCALVGFESLGSFSRLFQSQAGEPPIAYRRRKK